MLHHSKFTDQILNCMNAVHGKVLSDLIRPLMLAAGIQNNREPSEDCIDVCQNSFFIGLVNISC